MKRILAMAGVVLLVLLYIVTLVCAIINSPFSVQLFKASVAMTIIIPVLIFGYRLIYKILKDYFPARREERDVLPDLPKENANEKNE